MTPHDLATVIATLVGEARGRPLDPTDPADATLASAAGVRPSGPGLSRWCSVALAGVGPEVRAAVTAALVGRPEVAAARLRPGHPDGPVDVELSPTGLVAALRSLPPLPEPSAARAHSSVSPVRAGTGRCHPDGVVADPAPPRRPGTGTGAASGVGPRGADPLFAAQRAHARAVRRGVTARRCGVRPDVLAVAAGGEQLALVQALLDTEGALARARAVPSPAGGRRARAHAVSLAARAHAAFDAAGSRPLGDAPVTGGHALALALDDAAVYALARSLHAAGAAAPTRL